MKILILLLVSLALIACGVPQEEHDTVVQELADLKLASDTQISELQSNVQTLQQDYETVVKDYCPMSLAVKEVELALQVLGMEQEQNMSLRQQAKILGVSHPYLSQMINGRRPWNEDIKARYEELSATTFATTSPNRESLAFLTPSVNSADKTGYTVTNSVYNTHAPYRGAVAQLGERFNGIEEVRSSSLLSSTSCNSKNSLGIEHIDTGVCFLQFVWRCIS